jgi:hypothetical protein
MAANWSLGGCSSVVERLLPKQDIVGSSPITRSMNIARAAVGGSFLFRRFTPCAAPGSKPRFGYFPALGRSNPPTESFGVLGWRCFALTTRRPVDWECKCVCDMINRDDCSSLLRYLPKCGVRGARSALRCPAPTAPHILPPPQSAGQAVTNRVVILRRSKHAYRKTRNH